MLLEKGDGPFPVPGRNRWLFIYLSTLFGVEREAPDEQTEWKGLRPFLWSTVYHSIR